nr:MAG TPA: repressor [Caudoviricetes sp.]
MGKTERKSEFIALKVTPSFKARAKALAEEEGRSLSNYIDWLINNDIKRREKENEEA